MNHDLLIGRYDEKSKEQNHLRRNLWAAQTVQGSLNRRQGVSLSKADIIRKVVSHFLYLFNSYNLFLLTYTLSFNLYFKANLSISQQQKQQLLDTLATYLSGQDNLKKVINSPCLDKYGKFLSRDGQKVFTSHNRFNSRRGRGGGRGGGNNNSNRNDNRGGNGKSGRGRGKNNRGRGKDNSVSS